MQNAERGLDFCLLPSAFCICMSARLPEWIREKRLNLQQLHEVKSLLRARDLHSVCESLACPNRTECFSRRTATFMILGDICTRSCGFCNVTTGRPHAAPSPDEPRSVADAAKRMGLRHVVVTSVTREELDVVEYVHPTVFDEFAAIGESMGYRAVFAGPFVRSSYMADVVASVSSRA